MRIPLWCFAILIVATLGCVAQETVSFGSVLRTLEFEDSVKWIGETPQRPEDYVGQVVLVYRDGTTEPFLYPIQFPVATTEDDSVKKSVLIKSGKEGTVTFGDIFSLVGARESVYQFQVVHNTKWAADRMTPAYYEAVQAFRTYCGDLFTNPNYAGVLVCTGVVKKKIWYKVYHSREAGGAGSVYFVKVDGRDYWSSDEYEEKVLYGLLFRSLHGFGDTLPATITTPEQITHLTEQSVVPATTLRAVKTDAIKTAIKLRTPQSGASTENVVAGVKLRYPMYAGVQMPASGNVSQYYPYPQYPYFYVYPAPMGQQQQMMPYPAPGAVVMMPLNIPED